MGRPRWSIQRWVRLTIWRVFAESLKFGTTDFAPTISPAMALPALRDLARAVADSVQTSASGKMTAPPITSSGDADHEARRE